MKRLLLRLIWVALFLGVTYEAGIALAVFIIRRTPLMPYWLDLTIRYALEITHSDINDPEDISTIANLATFVVSWIAVGFLLLAGYVIGRKIWRGRKRSKPINLQ